MSYFYSCLCSQVIGAFVINLICMLMGRERVDLTDAQLELTTPADHKHPFQQQHGYCSKQGTV